MEHKLTEVNDLIYLLKYSLNNQKADFQKVSNMDLTQLFSLADSHKITACVAFTLENIGLDDETYKPWKQAKSMAVRNNLLLNNERNDIYNYMEENHILHVSLKGIVLQDLYPKFGMREMGDNDILFDQSSQEQMYDYMNAHGYHTIVRNGLVPVFCDIKSDDFTIDTTKIEALITEKTVAIIPVHVYGNICNVEEIDRIAQKFNLKVIYDAAHAFGVTYKGKNIACFGDASMFSFHATKVFNTIEGGAVCFKDDNLVVKLNDLKNFGIHGPESVEFVGGNAKMSEFQAAMGICNLRHLDEEIAKRKIVVERYRSHLHDVKGIKLSPIQSDVVSNYAYFPVVFDKDIFGSDRDEVFVKLAENGIGARKYFYPLTNTFDCYKGMFDVNDTPIAFDISMKVLTLPLYADLSLEDVDRIGKIIISTKS